MESWPWGDTVCRVSEVAKDVSIGVSVFTLTALSADRYFAIVDPLRKLHATGEWMIHCIVKSWPWDDTGCHVTEAAKNVSIGMSVFTLMVLFADRYFALVDPLRKL